MRAVLEFQLPEEREDFEIATDGWRYRGVISDVLNQLRSKIKYTEETTIALDAVREMIWEYCREYEVDGKL